MGQSERWTIHVCKDCRQLAHGPGSRCAADRRRTWTEMETVEVVPVSEYDRLAALLDREFTDWREWPDA